MAVRLAGAGGRRRSCTARARCSGSRPGPCTRSPAAPAAPARSRRDAARAGADQNVPPTCNRPGPIRNGDRPRADSQRLPAHHHEARDADARSARCRARACRRRPASATPPSTSAGRKDRRSARARRRGSPRTDADDEADADTDADDARAGEAEPERVAPPLDRRRGGGGGGAWLLDDDDLGMVGQVLRASSSAICVAFACTPVGLRREEALVQRHRALAVARETLRLALREQELAPRIDRVARLEVGDAAA